MSEIVTLAVEMRYAVQIGNDTVAERIARHITTLQRDEADKPDSEFSMETDPARDVYAIPLHFWAEVLIGGGVRVKRHFQVAPYLPDDREHAEIHCLHIHGSNPRMTVATAGEIELAERATVGAAA